MVKRPLTQITGEDPKNDNTKKHRLSGPAWPTAEELGEVFVSRTNDTSSERIDKVDIFLPVMPYNMIGTKIIFFLAQENNADDENNQRGVLIVRRRDRPL